MEIKLSLFADILKTLEKKNKPFKKNFKTKKVTTQLKNNSGSEISI